MVIKNVLLVHDKEAVFRVGVSYSLPHSNPWQSANLFNKQIKMLQDGGGLQDFTNGEGAKEGGCLIRERD